MSWKLINRPRTLKVTKTLAEEYAQMEPAPHDRPLSERRLQVYARLLNEGKFRPVTWAKVFCRETGGSYRVNGKHTSTLLAGLAITPEFYVTLEEYECESLEDIAKLYSTFDSSVQSRTSNEIYASFAGTSVALRDIPHRIISLATTGIAYHSLGNDRYGKTQPAERAEYMLDEPDFVIWLQNLFSVGPTAKEIGYKNYGRCPHMARLGVVAAMYATWKKSSKSAGEFWGMVRDETGSAPEMPDRKLSRFLLLTRSKGTGSGTKAIRANNRELYAKCLHAWNAWRRNEGTNLNYFADKPVPTAI